MYNFDLTMEDHTIILNEKITTKNLKNEGLFQQYDDERINKWRDKLAHQLIWNNTDIDKFVRE